MKSFIKESHKEACLTYTKRLVSYPSVIHEGQNGTPFGQAIQDVLEATLQLCQDLGFSTYIDPKGYYGYAEVGQGEELLAVLCHLDVVPAGPLNEWKTDPFEATLIDGMLYGRGVQDDKGPSVAALLAAKALMDAGVTFKKRLRFIFGTDEETLWRCMARYNELEEVADMGFAPDSSFPLTYAEKGLLQAKLLGPGQTDLSLELGGAYNVVPGKAPYQGDKLEEVKGYLDRLGHPYQEDETGLTVLGRDLHSKDAMDAQNALVALCQALYPLYPLPVLDFLANQVGMDGSGAHLLGPIEDEPSGSLSFNVAGLSLSPDKTEVRLDIRIPVLASKEDLVARLKEKAANYGLSYEEFDYLAPLYVPLESPLITTLMQVYQEKTGDRRPAESSGGATFARTMTNCVAFGAGFPGTPQTEHQANEGTPIQDLYKAMEIYAEALYRLLDDTFE